MNQRARLAVIAAAASIAAACPASAQQARDASRDHAGHIVEELTGCRAIADSAERLACFDRTSAEFVAARDRKDLVVVDRTEMRTARRSLFGFPLPRIRLFGGGEDDVDEPEIKEVTSKVRSISETGFRKWLIALEDGSRWQTIEVTNATPPTAGKEIRITRTALGGYMIHLSTGNVRARRVE